MAAEIRERPMPTGEGLTFEKVWAMFQESDRRMQEFERVLKEEEVKRAKEEAARQEREAKWRAEEAARQEKEAKRREEEEAVRQEKEAARQEKEAKRREEDDRAWKDLKEQMGGLHNTFGELAEHLVAPGIHDRFNELGFHFKEVLPGGVKIMGDDGKIRAHVDLLLQNDDTVLAIEVKAKIAMKDIDQHARRVEIIRNHRHKCNDKRKILGAIAGAVFGQNEKEAAIEAGFYVIVQAGDTMKMEIPSAFVPREW